MPGVSLKKRRQPARQERRLQACRAWASALGPGPHGRAVVHKYARANKIDALCALKDLERLGVRIDANYSAELRARRPSKKDSESASGLENGYGIEWDDNYSYIAGHTSGGAPFGITWEESEADHLSGSIAEDPDDGVPF